MRRFVASARTASVSAALATCCLGCWACCLGCWIIAPTASAQPETTASIQPSFLPDRLGANTTLTLAVRFSGGTEGVPAPLRQTALRLPAGLGIGLSGAKTCAKSRLQSKGAAGCPTSSLVGRGHGLLEALTGSLTSPEEATISIFRGPSQGGRPTLEILSQGETPLYERTVSTAVLRPDSAPYGTKLMFSVPPIPTLRYEPDASFVSLSLTLGGIGRNPRAHAAAATITAPRSCPAGGFPFAASFAFAEGLEASASARVPCP